MTSLEQTTQPEPLPPLATLEHWAYQYVTSCSLTHKLEPGPLPNAWALDAWEVNAPSRNLSAPGRPDCLRVVKRQRRRFNAASLAQPEMRARLLHVFFHHELQAAELMCWAFLRFADAEQEFRRGLLAICVDEIRHMKLYRERLLACGHDVSDFEVRDWFWERVPTCTTKLSFVSLMGLGLEAANLEHAPRFASWFRAVADEASARVQERVEREEVAHVAFAQRWFSTWQGELRFDTWSKALPAPLSPLLMKGNPLNRTARRKAGMPVAFLEELERWVPETHGI
jgi:uncharacterized ferritin-like protein (DUF455 family)